MLVFGPLPGPTIIVDVATNGGGIGCIQLICVFGVEDVPVANTVGLLHVSVCVKIFIATFGEIVFCEIITGKIVLQKFVLSCTTTVHVPGKVVTVEVFPI